MFRVFHADAADELWVKIAREFRGSASDQPSRSGPTKELLHVALSINYPQQRFVISRNPPINIAFGLAEVIWILAGRNDSHFPNYFNRDYSRYCGNGPSYHGA